MFGKQVGCLVDPLTYKQEILKFHAINTLPQSGVLKYVAKMHNGGARDDFKGTTLMILGETDLISLK